MELVVLNVADPFACVGSEAVGNAEQMLTKLDAALVHAGHESFVMACEGSAAEGILLATPKLLDPGNPLEREKVYEQYRFTLHSFLEKWPIDLIHMHGPDFYEYLPPAGVPVLVTLHLPVETYPQFIFRIDRPQTFLQCTSLQQHYACPPCANLLPALETGSDDDAFSRLHSQSLGSLSVATEYLGLYDRLVGESRALQDLAPATGQKRVPEEVFQA
jgi:hypothetical protein